MAMRTVQAGDKTVYQRGESLREEMKSTVVPTGCIAIWGLGQVGVVIKGSGQQEMGLSSAIAVDPYLTRSIDWNNPGNEWVSDFDSPLHPEDLTGVAAVFITHHHDDHMDLPTISRLHKASPVTKFVIPAPHLAKVRDAGVSDEAIIPAHAGKVIEIGHVRALPIAAAHTSYETDEAGDHLYLGYVITMDGIQIYHSGDTVVTRELIDELQGQKPHIAMLPVNGQDYERTSRGIVGNMGAREAVDFATAIGADLLMPNHYDMFQCNRDNPAHFVDYLFHHHRNLKFHMLAVGERFIYMR